jgi:hypothetical protein
MDRRAAASLIGLEAERNRKTSSIKPCGLLQAVALSSLFVRRQRAPKRERSQCQSLHTRV